MALLEEIADERRLRAATGDSAAEDALRQLRSRRGFDRARALGLLTTARAVRAARAPASPMAAAMLAPYAPQALRWPSGTPPPVLEIGDRLRAVAPESARHLALVEAVRRLFRLAAMAADRSDKEAALDRQS